MIAGQITLKGKNKSKKTVYAIIYGREHFPQQDYLDFYRLG